MDDGWFGVRDPLLEHTDDRNDDGDTTGPFQPGGASTPGPSGEQYPMSTMNRPPERGPHTAETSFIEGVPSGRVSNTDSLRIQTANETLKQSYPDYGENGKFLTLEVSQKKYPGKVVVRGPKGGETTLFKADGVTLNPKISKTDMKTLGPERAVLIQENEQQREEIQQEIVEDEQIANNENEEPAIREQAREKVREKTEQLNALENERERLEEGQSLKEKVKAIFKKYGFTVTAVLLAIGTTIGVILSSLSKGLKSVADGFGKGFQALGKKLGSILPGLLGAIASFVFRTAGQVISFLGKNAWLLVVAVAVFLIERVSKR